MAMTMKASKFKQNLSFKSLRLMEKRESFGSNWKSFSDSEVTERGDFRKEKAGLLTKNKSENCLNIYSRKKANKHSKEMSSKYSLVHNETISYSLISVPIDECKNMNTSRKNVTSETFKKDESINSNVRIATQLSESNRTNITTEKAKNLISISNESLENLHGLNGSDKFFSNQHKMPVTATGENRSSQSTAKSCGIESQNPLADPEISSPYRILEGATVVGLQNENILGEPRCLTLKKYSGDVNPFLTDNSLIFEPDFEDESGVLQERSSHNSEKQNRKLHDRISDMFMDEEEIKQCKKKAFATDREEGELSPEVNPSSSEVEKINPPSSKLKADFFDKINKCLRELDQKCKDFYSSSIPEHSVKHLQRTLSNVDSIKRKLSFLIYSKNTESERRKKIRKSTEKYSSSRRSSKSNFEKSTSHSHSKLERKSLSENMTRPVSSSTQFGDNKHPAKHVNRSSGGFNPSENDKGFNPETKENSEVLPFNKEDDNERKQSGGHSKHSHRTRRSSKEKPSQIDLLNRKKSNILEKLGTRQEIQRVQSLFKRQMNLITQHVIQKKEASKSHNSSQEEPERNRKHHYIPRQVEQNHEQIHEKIDLNSLKTLEDMETFLDTLKNRTGDKILSEQYLKDEKWKGALKFTSKKENSSKWQYLLETQTIPLPTIVKSEKDLKNKIAKQPADKENWEAIFLSKNQNEIPDKTKLEEFQNTIKEVDLTSTLGNSLHENHEQLTECSLTISDDSHSKSVANKHSDQKRIENTAETNKIGKEGKISHVCLQEEVVFSKNDKNSSYKKAELGVPKSMEQHDKSSSFNDASRISKQESIKGKRKGHSVSESNESGNEEKQIHKRRKTSKHSISPRKLTSDETEEKDISIRKSQIKSSSNVKKSTKDVSDSLMKDLLSKKVFVLDDNNFSINNQFCLKVIGNEVYLKKLSSRRRHNRSRRTSESQQSKNIKRSPGYHRNSKKTCDEIEHNPICEENIDTTLEEMENFLQQLRSKRKVSDDEQNELIGSNSQSREEKFLARIQAKRKAKLMACFSDGPHSIEKEAKFLKALEKRNKELSDSSDIESRKQKLIEKIRAETDAIVLADKPGAKQNADDDPLIDVKTFLNIIKEAESADEEISKQVCVSFSLKRSDVKRLESLTTGKMSPLSEESQKFLNSVRAKMRAKKTPVSNISALMQKPEP